MGEDFVPFVVNINNGLPENNWLVSMTLEQYLPILRGKPTVDIAGIRTRETTQAFDDPTGVVDD